MKTKWKDAGYSFTARDLGPIKLSVGWGSSRDEKCIVECSALGLRKGGFESTKAAQTAAERLARRALSSALEDLGDDGREEGK